MILKPIDQDWTCPATTADIDDVFKNLFGFNGIQFIQTDAAGAQLEADPYSFFAVNRVLLIRPISKNPNNRYSSAAYDCLLTIAKPALPDMEVEGTTGDVGQFEQITKEFLTLEFLNTLKSYFQCCRYPVNIVQVRPIWNSTIAAKRINHSGVEINLTVEI